MTQPIIHESLAENNDVVLEKRKNLPEFDRKLLEYEDALALCLNAVQDPVGTEELTLENSLGRVLREDMISQVFVPPESRSMMDGYAVIRDDVKCATDDHPVTLTQIDNVPAGHVSMKRLGPGETIRIMTGAVMPQGANAVIRLECSRCLDGRQVIIMEPVGENPYVLLKGQDLVPGIVTAKSGTLITPAVMGVLASCGVSRVKVSRRPTMAVIATGNELVDPGQIPGAGQIYNINGYSLYGLSMAAGAKPVYGGIVRDKSDDLLHVLCSHMDKDIILLSGGVSVGDYDIVHETLVRAGVEEIFWRVKVKPGKPLFFGRKGKTLIFGLPGNPVSSMVNFYVFVRPVIDKLSGKQTYGLDTSKARIINNRIIQPGRRKFYRGRLSSRNSRLEVEIIPEQRSGVFSPMATANVLIEIPGHIKVLKTGDMVRVHHLDCSR